MTPSRSRVRIDRIDLDLVHYTFMSMGKRHQFYTRLNQRLAEHYFDDFVEGQCQSFYAEIMRQPGLPQ